MKLSKQRRLAAIGCLFGAAYLVLNRTAPTVPELLLGLLLGLALVLMVVGLLPEESWQKLRKWKRRGE